MEKFIELALRKYKTILILIILFSLSFSFLLYQLRIDSNLINILPEDKAEISLFKRVLKEFNSLNVIMIGVESKALFSPDKLKALLNFSADLKEIEGVLSVDSIVDILDIVSAKTKTTIDYLVPRPIPEEKEVLRQLKKKVLSRKHIVGSLLSKNGQAALLICTLDESKTKVILDRIRATAHKYFSQDETYFYGPAFLNDSVSAVLVSELKKLLPILIVLIVAIKLIFLWNISGVMISLISILIVLLWTLYGISLSGAPINMLNSFALFLIFIFADFFNTLLLSLVLKNKAFFADPHSAILSGLRKILGPFFVILLASLLLALGFILVNGSSLASFGVYLILGSLVMAVVTLFFTPGFLLLIKNRIRIPSPKFSYENFKETYLAGLIKYNRLIFIALCGLVIIAVIYLPRLQFNPDLNKQGDPGSEPSLATAFIDRNFSGSQFLQVYLKGDFKDPFVLKEMEKLEEFIKTLPHVVQTQSVVPILKLANQAFTEIYAIPDTRGKVESLIANLEGTAALYLLMNKKWQAGQIIVRLDTLPHKDIKAIARLIETYISQDLLTAMRVVNKNGLSDPDQKSQLLKLVLARVAERFTYLLKEKGRPVTKDSFYFLPGMSAAGIFSHLEKRFYQIVATYFKSDEAAVDLAKTADVKALSQAIFRLNSTSSLTSKTLIAQLVPYVTAEFQKDPVNLFKAAGALRNQVNEERKKVIFAFIAGQLKKQKIPIYPEENSDFQALLYDLEDCCVAVPDKKGQTSLSAVVTGEAIMTASFNRMLQKGLILFILAAIILIGILKERTNRSIRAGLFNAFYVGLCALLYLGFLGLFQIQLQTTTPISLIFLIILVLTSLTFFEYEVTFEPLPYQDLMSRLKQYFEIVGYQGALIFFLFGVLVFSHFDQLRQISLSIILLNFIALLGGIVILPTGLYLIRQWTLQPAKTDSPANLK